MTQQLLTAPHPATVMAIMLAFLALGALVLLVIAVGTLL